MRNYCVDGIYCIGIQEISEGTGIWGSHKPQGGLGVSIDRGESIKKLWGTTQTTISLKISGARIGGAWVLLGK